MTEKVLYIGVVLTKESQQKLFDYFKDIPSDWRKIGHHMTTIFKDKQKAIEPNYFHPDIKFGMKINLIPFAFKKDEKGLAIAVIPNYNATELRIESACPHVTIAVAPGISPVYSNELLAAGELTYKNSLSLINLEGYLVKVLPEGKVSPEINEELADEKFG
jgi:hypothetical protein